MAEADEVRARIEVERQRLAHAVGELKAEVDRKRRQPISVGASGLAGLALAGFVLSGGVRGTLRLIGARERRRREEAPNGARAWLSQKVDW